MDKKIILKRVQRAKFLKNIVNPASKWYFKFSLIFLLLKIIGFDFSNFRSKIFSIAYITYAVLILLLPLSVDDEKFQEDWLKPNCLFALSVAILLQTVEMMLIVYSIL